VVPDFNQIVMMVVNGAIGAGGSDLVYDFLRAKPGSPQFSLSSKPITPPKPVEPIKVSPEVLDAMLKDGIQKAIASLQIPIIKEEARP
jgi:hypothetical protein